ncbi:hypothetical protein H6F89_34065 [Cyanobacteria bacterium FACHB-63]|nr:hypothetical protein [Cyanobacteria bacterium FACHB-63]
MNEDQFNWQVFQGDHTQDGNRITQLSPPPPWRQFRGQLSKVDPTSEQDLTSEQKEYKETITNYWQQIQSLSNTETHTRDRQRGESFRIRTDQAKVIQAVNAALALRRPLLITGRPGSGKTSLAYAIAYELKLGPVLMWPITARSTLEAGLYRYDAIARLQDAQLLKQEPEPDNGDNPPTDTETNMEAEQGRRIKERNVGDYIQLGPLGTAFVPALYPRVLLIDEIDKSDINLPNDLLNLLEEGQFEIPELVRLAEYQRQDKQMQDGQGSATVAPPSPERVEVRTADNLKVMIEGGKLRCDAFPLIVMTSNGERDFPSAFLRRCLRVEMPKPEKDDLYNIVEAHLTEDVAKKVNDLIERFLMKTDTEAVALATDQLLNAVYLRKYGATLEADSDLERLIFAALTSSGSAG